MKIGQIYIIMLDIENLMLAADISIVIGPTLGLWCQYQKISKTKSCEGFVPKTFLIVMLSTFSKLFVWYTRGFPFPLLWQSILIDLFQVKLNASP